MIQPNIKGSVAERVLAVLTKGYGPSLTLARLESILGHETVETMHAVETLRIAGQVEKVGRAWRIKPPAAVKVEERPEAPADERFRAFYTHDPKGMSGFGADEDDAIDALATEEVDRAERLILKQGRYS